MLLSIIIPSFQLGHELLGALDSISQQDFFNYEIIIVDGGSTDTTATVINESDLPIYFLQEPDAGVYDAMNKGIKLAKGKWLYFMGADDRLAKGVLNTIADYLQRNDVDIFYGNVTLTSNGNSYDGFFDLDKLLYKKNICHQAIFYGKHVFDKVGNYNLRYKIWADWDFNIRCFKHTELSVKYIDVTVAHYNDQYGVSSTYDKVFCHELPSYYLNTIAALENEKAGLLSSKSFVIGNRLVNIFNKMGLRKLFTS